MKVNVAAAEKKHDDSVKASGKEAEETKSELDTEQTTLDLAKGTLDVAKGALDTAAGAYQKVADEEKAAAALATDDSWEKDAQELQNSVRSISALREAVEKWNGEYVHSTASASTTT